MNIEATLSLFEGRIYNLTFSGRDTVGAIVIPSDPRIGIERVADKVLRELNRSKEHFTDVDFILDQCVPILAAAMARLADENITLLLPVNPKENPNV